MHLLLIGSLIGAVFSFIGSMVAAAIFEAIKQPDITITEGEIYDMPEILGPSGERVRPNGRFLRARVANAKMRLWPRRVARSRYPAVSCRATISFYRVDQSHRPIVVTNGRWIKLPEPLPMEISFGQQVGHLYDRRVFAQDPTVDIYSGRDEQLDLLVRLDDDEDSYGWTDHSYFFPGFRNPKSRIPPAEFLVKVEVDSGGTIYWQVLYFDNTKRKNSILLRVATPIEVAKLPTSGQTKHHVRVGPYR